MFKSFFFNNEKYKIKLTLIITGYECGRIIMPIKHRYKINLMTFGGGWVEGGEKGVKEYVPERGRRDGEPRLTSTGHFEFYSWQNTPIYVVQRIYLFIYLF